LELENETQDLFGGRRERMILKIQMRLQVLMYAGI
jgi:hypothetical protein